MRTTLGKRKGEREEIGSVEREEVSNESAKKPIHSLEGTKYGLLEKQVKNMIARHKTNQKQLKVSLKSKNMASEEAMHPNKRRRAFEKELHTAPSELSSSNPEVNEYVNNKTIYVQGLPFTCTEDQLRDFFKDIGEIKSLRLPRWHDSGKLKGYGHVEFLDEESAQQALELSGQYIGDRYITVEKPMVPRSLSSLSSPSESGEKKERPPGCRTVYIRNLPYEINEEEIRQTFMVYGPISSIRLAIWNHTNNLKGFGYIEFKREDSAEIAVKKSGSIRLKNRIISVDYETTGPKRGYKGLHKEDSSSSK